MTRRSAGCNDSRERELCPETRARLRDRSPDHTSPSVIGAFACQEVTMTRPTAPACDCGQPATHQTQRDATDAEAAVHQQTVNQWRVSQELDPLPEDSAIFTAPVTVAEFHCCEHRPDDHGPCAACLEEASRGE